MKQLLVYLIIVNALGFALMLADKQKAKKNLWRIPEATLLGVAMVGGSLGCLCGMYAAKHKTRRPAFSLGLPVILSAQIILLVLIFFR